MYVTPQNGRRYILTDKPINLSSRKVYGKGLLFHYEDHKPLFNQPDWETCYYSIDTTNVVIKGQLCPKNQGFKPSEFDDNYFDNIDIVYNYKKQHFDKYGKGMNFHDNSIGIHLLLKNHFKHDTSTRN